MRRNQSFRLSKTLAALLPINCNLNLLNHHWCWLHVGTALSGSYFKFANERLTGSSAFEEHSTHCKMWPYATLSLSFRVGTAIGFVACVHRPEVKASIENILADCELQSENVCLFLIQSSAQESCVNDLIWVSKSLFRRALVPSNTFFESLRSSLSIAGLNIDRCFAYWPMCNGD